jgi:valyl-tRNA synthetase
MEKVEVEQLSLPWLEEKIGPPACIHGHATLEDEWIFHRLNETADRIDKAQATYRYHEVADLLYGFFWDEFCDWYVELKKLRIQQTLGTDEAKIHIRNLLRVFEFGLRMLHPVMPFLTEELWQRLVEKNPRIPETICLAAFPQPDPDVANPAAASDFALFQEMVTAARALRADQKLDPKQQLEGVLHPHGDRTQAIAASQLAALQSLTNTSFHIASVGAEKSAGAARSTPEFDVVLKLGGAQAEVMRQRLQKEIEQLTKVIDSSRRQLSSESFVSKAPASVVDGLKAKLADYEAQLSKSQASLAEL